MIQRTMPWKRRGHHHAQIHFPPLTGEEALLIANILERVVTALWRTHGDAMADLLACCDPDAARPDEPSDPPVHDASEYDDNTF